MARHLIQAEKIFPVKESDLELSIPIDDEATYYLRPLPIEKLREFTKANTRQVPNRKTHQKDDVVDGEQLANDVLDYVIERWEGVKVAGQPAPCDLEHKLALPDEVQQALVTLARTGSVTAEERDRSFRKPA